VQETENHRMNLLVVVKMDTIMKITKPPVQNVTTIVSHVKIKLITVSLVLEIESIHLNVCHHLL